MSNQKEMQRVLKFATTVQAQNTKWRGVLIQCLFYFSAPVVMPIALIISKLVGHPITAFSYSEWEEKAQELSPEQFVEEEMSAEKLAAEAAEEAKLLPAEEVPASI